MSNLRIFEIILYSCLNLIPYLGLAIYPFIDKLRFSKKTTMFLQLFLQYFKMRWGYMQQPVRKVRKDLFP